MRGALAVLFVVFAACGTAVRDTAPAHGGEPAGLRKRCASGSVAAVISHRRVCLRAGQRCDPGLDREYRGYGFRCPLTGRLERIPPAVGTVIASIPGSLGGYVAAGEGAVWVRDASAQVLRVDPERNAIADRIQLPLPASTQPFSGLSGIAAGDGGVWVSLASHDEVVRIDPVTDAIVARIPVGEAPAGIAVMPGSVWVANRFEHSVSRIDPSTNRLVATIRFGEGQLEGPTSIAAGAGAVWVVAPEVRGVIRINPATNAIDAVIPVPLARNMAPLNGIAADPSAGVWVAGSDLTHIDPDSNRVVATIPSQALPVGVAIGLGSVWETSWAGWAAGRLSRINPSTNATVGESYQGDAYSAIAVGSGSIWVQGGGLRRVLPR